MEVVKRRKRENCAWMTGTVPFLPSSHKDVQREEGNPVGKRRPLRTKEGRSPISKASSFLHSPSAAMGKNVVDTDIGAF